MMQILEQTHDEKVAMYMKLSKKELAQMLATRDMIERNRQPVVYYPDQKQPAAPNPCWYIFDPATGQNPFHITTIQ